MKIEILDDDLTKRVYDVSAIPKSETVFAMIDSSSKEQSIVEILSVYKGKKKALLFDKSNQAIKTFLDQCDFTSLNTIDFTFLLFTSGTTGLPVGAFKSLQNLESEVDTLCSLVKEFTPKKVISTVPFIHIYGILTSVLLPYRLHLPLFFKEHFLPHDLLSNIEPYSIVVTTPLYIKSLVRLSEVRSLKNVLFISSTGPLDNDTARAFIDKFDTNLIQLFGSTETGGIAYKRQDETWWTPLSKVSVSVDKRELLNVSSPYVSEFLYDKGIKKTGGEIQSLDYVEFNGERFKIIGRNSQIFKVGGKRFSTLHVEEILEKMAAVDKAYVSIEYKRGELKDEVLQIYIQCQEPVNIGIIKKELMKHYGKIQFPITVSVVEKIPTTALGKKMMPI